MKEYGVCVVSVKMPWTQHFPVTFLYPVIMALTWLSSAMVPW